MFAHLDYVIFRLRYLLRYGRTRPEHELEIRRIYNERIGLKQVRQERHYQIVSYERDGQLDYDLYKRIQTAGNKGKLDSVFAQETNIRALCQALEKIVPSIDFVLCHGTRNAAEQKFFQNALSKPAAILGTEISETASRFPMTIEWDFHEVKPEWLGAVDVIYSNSWDHSYDPRKLFTAWLSCLRFGGVMVLEWTHQHGGRINPSILDPVVMPLNNLLALLEELCADGCYRIAGVMRDLPQPLLGRTFVLVQRTTESRQADA